jgi:lipopolysaccharide biosynthesis regulator YciM
MPFELLLWLLLPVAAASGWWTATRRTRATAPHLPPDYFRGIDFLLNVQPDKAIGVFTRMVEIDSDTVEPHFALGSLFRRQGETERAIRIHQNLIARPQLPRAQHDRALLELARDYTEAGLLDRAEQLFRELLEREPRNATARALLVDIYEQEREWEKAIEAAPDARAAGEWRRAVAHFHCELAEQALKAGDFPRVRRLVRRACASDRECVRASLLAGESARAQDDHKAAIRALRRVEKQDPRFFCEAVEALLDRYERLGRGREAAAYLREVAPSQRVFRAVLAAARGLARLGQADEARGLMLAHIRAHPSLPGVAHLVESLSARAERAEELETARKALEEMLDMTAAYHCEKCNYTGNTLRWQCPSCRSWGTIVPRAGA